MTFDERNKLISLVAVLDTRIIEATARAVRTTDDILFEMAISEVRQLRAERAETQAKLDGAG
jgi:hypothetical protein